MDLECTEAIQSHKEKTLHVFPPMWILAYSICMDCVTNVQWVQHDMKKGKQHRTNIR